MSGAVAWHFCIVFQCVRCEAFRDFEYCGISMHEQTGGGHAMKEQ